MVVFVNEANESEDKYLVRVEIDQIKMMVKL